MLTEMTFEMDICHIFCLLELPQGRRHTSRHIVLLCASRSRNIHHVKLHLSNLVWWSSLDPTQLASRAACDCLILDSPFVEAWHINGVRTTKGLLFMVLQTDVRPGKATVRTNKFMLELPLAWMLSGSLTISVLLLTCCMFLLFSLPLLHFSPLFGRCEESGELRDLAGRLHRGCYREDCALW